MLSELFEEEDFPSPTLLLDDPHAAGETPPPAVLVGAAGVREARGERVAAVREVLGLTFDAAALLLAAHGWDAPAACEAACEDFDAAMRRAGVAVGAAHCPVATGEAASAGRRGTTPSPTQQRQDQEVGSDSVLLPMPGGDDDAGSKAGRGATFTCPVCCSDDVPVSALPQTTCGHDYCGDCWAHYVGGKLEDGKFTRIRCMEPSCDVLLPAALVREVLPAPAYERYASFQARSFVETNRLATWCPAPGCDNAVVLDSAADPLDVRCACGHRFCFRCNAEAHAPATCANVVDWAKQCESDGETAKWLQVNTKDCPKCGVAVEKNGGCQHMSCVKCNHQYCWHCLKNWRGHVSCNRFEDAAAELALNETRSSLQRYIHYFDRFETHARALKADAEPLRRDAAERAQDRAGTAAAEILPRAVDVLIAARRVLKYSYVYAFFLKHESRHKVLFENLQEMVENRVRELLTTLETFDGSEAHEGRITHTASNADRVIRNLLECTADAIELEAAAAVEAAPAGSSSSSSSKSNGKNKERINPARSLLIDSSSLGSVRARVASAAAAAGASSSSSSSSSSRLPVPPPPPLPPRSGHTRRASSTMCLP
jgi:ariadne-1